MGSDDETGQEFKRSRRDREKEVKPGDRKTEHKSRKRSRRSHSPEDESPAKRHQQSHTANGETGAQPVVENANGEISMSIEETNK